MTIAILCPTRGRPEQFERMAESVRAASINAEVYWTGGEYESRYRERCRGPYHGLHENLPTVMKWNALAKQAMMINGVNLFMLGSDDMYFDTPGWDKALLDHYNKLENKIHVYALQDSRDADGTPHVIVTREYIEALGYFVPPIFLHWFVDSWTVEIAKANNVFTHFREYTLVHDKPSDRGHADATHSRIRDWGWHSRDEYVSKTCAHFLQYEIGRLSELIVGRKNCSNLGPRASGVWHEELRQTGKYLCGGGTIGGDE